MVPSLLRSHIERKEGTLAVGGLWRPSGLDGDGLSRRGILFGGFATIASVGLVGCGPIALVESEALAASGFAGEIFKRALVDFIGTFLSEGAAWVIEQAKTYLVDGSQSDPFHYSFSPFGVDKSIPCTTSKYGVSVEVNLRARADHTRTIPVIKDMNTRELQRITYEAKNTGAIVTPCGARSKPDSGDKAAFTSLCQTKYNTDPTKFNLEYCRPAHLKRSKNDAGTSVTSYGVAYRDDPTSGDLLVDVA